MPPRPRDYVDRLVAADVAALGFGVGLSHQAVPAALVSAAEAAGLPLLEVPQPIPFVALSKAVSRLLTDEEYAESAASFESQRRLIRAALAEPPACRRDPGPRQARRRLRAAPRPDRRGRGRLSRVVGARASELAGEVDRLRSRGLLASAALATADEHVVILPIGVKGAADGFLVVGCAADRCASADQAVMNLAVSVLSWRASQPVADGRGHGRLAPPARRRRGTSTDWRRTCSPAWGWPACDPWHAVGVAVRGVERDAGLADADLAAAHRGGDVVLCRTGSGELDRLRRGGR